VLPCRLLPCVALLWNGKRLTPPLTCWHVFHPKPLTTPFAFLDARQELSSYFLNLETEEDVMASLNRRLSSISLAAVLGFGILGLVAKADQCDEALPPKGTVNGLSAEFEAVAATSDKTTRCQGLVGLVGSVAYNIEITYNPDYIKKYLSTCSNEQIEGSRAPFDALFKRINEKRLNDGCAGF
jgi:hypothetical protein